MKRRPALFLWVAEIAAWLIANMLFAGSSLKINFTVFTVSVIILVSVISIIIWRIGASVAIQMAPIIFAIFLLMFGNYNRRQNDFVNAMERNIPFINENGLTGRIDKIEYKNGYSYLYIENAKTADNMAIGGCMIMVTEDYGCETGMTIYAKGNVTGLGRATNPGQFDSYEYYLSKNIVYRMIDPEVKHLENNTALEHALFSVKKKLTSAIERTGGDNKGVYEAMLLGEKGELSEETKNLYQAAGISHILAISGLHVSFIGMIIFAILRLFGIKQLQSSVLTSLIVAIYAYIIGSPVSAVRAAIMLAISLLAKGVGRNYDIITATAISWMIVSIFYPRQLSQPGFQLSFGAMIAFAFINPQLIELLSFVKQKRKRRRGLLKGMDKLETALIGSISVSLVTWPVIAWHMYVINPASIFLNLLIVPLMSVLMIIILLNLIISLLILAKILPALIAVYTWKPGDYILLFYQKVCEYTSGGFQVVTGRPLIWQIGIYTAVVIIVVIVISFINSRLEKYKDYLEIKDIRWNEVYKREKRIFRVVFPFILLGIQMGGLFIINRPQEKNTFVMLDVGQGDGMIYMSGKVCLAIDGGNSFMTGIGSYRIEPALAYYGYDRIDAWYVTHPDKDHISGLYEILEDKSSPITIKSVCISHSDAEGWAKLKELAGDRVSIREINSGEIYGWKTGRLEILYPHADEEVSETNELSLVMRLETAGRSVLLCGDIDNEVENVLLDEYSQDSKLKADILKVAHHGSKYASQTEFLEKVNAELAIISVGKNNYGHPAPDTLERLENEGLTILTTQDYGAIIIDLNTGKIWTG